MPKVFKLMDSLLEANIGSFARQADGSVWLKHGDNIVLATVVVAKSGGREAQGFFPLTVEFRERLSSVGKIPGGFIKREGKLSDAEVLASRVIDRSIRPLFPKFFMEEVQVMLSLLSYDGEVPLEVLGVLAASVAIISSNLPFKSPVGAVICARKKDSEWTVNPNDVFLKEAADQVLVVGTDAGICMIEADCDFISDSDLINLVNGIALKEIKKIVDWQKEIALDFPIKRRDYEICGLNDLAQAEWMEKIQAVLPSNHRDYFFAESKSELSEKMSFLKKVIKESLADEVADSNINQVSYDMLVDVFLKKIVPEILIEEKHRFDHRPFDKIRDIDSVVDLLPKVHGSAVFTRGQTQALSSVTLGASDDAQRIETLLYGVKEKSFMLHYNFPPYATGEVKPLRGVGRREIGHGSLAEKSFKNILPDAKSFPYTIRSLVDVLESNGSSSMATVCATTLAFMDAGIPIKKMISGIAMGLLVDSNKNIAILSDITGTEDAYGTMDLKVVGDEEGITAIQIDVKGDEGISSEVLAQALAQARVGRTHILNEMRKCLTVPRVSLKDSVPRCFSLKIPQSKIGMVIGPSGKNIKQITAETGTKIDIAEDGTISIFAADSASAKKAEGWIRALTGEIKNGSVFQGKISKITDFGIFVSLVPGKDGLIHISSIDRSKRETLETLYKHGDPLDVVVVSVDFEGKVKLIAPELESNDDLES
jgi:polyribonucleotide nucleotidyltransferase